jgi:glutathione S-transferase
LPAVIRSPTWRAWVGCGSPSAWGRLAQFPHLKRWFEPIRARPAVKRAFAIRVEAASAVDMKDPNVRAILFGQTAR